MKIGLGRKGKKRSARSMSKRDPKSTYQATHGNMKGRKKAKLAYKGGKRVKAR